MKGILLFAATLIILSLPFCKKAAHSSPVIVIKDCTGTYLRVSGRDYQVCNPEVVAYPNGTTVNATFRFIKECHGSASTAIVCMMFHQDYGWVEVDKISKQ